MGRTSYPRPARPGDQAHNPRVTPVSPTNAVIRRADIDPSGRFRYSLTREWSAANSRIAFVMLNPSTADHNQDDPTIRRCMGFARSWGFGALDVVNLFALRATDPRELSLATDPIGQDNPRALRRVLERADETLLAWGSSVRHAPPPALARALDTLAQCAADRPLSCLGLTAHAHPRHPLFVRGDTPRTPCTLIAVHKKRAARSDRPVQVMINENSFPV